MERPERRSLGRLMTVAGKVGEETPRLMGRGMRRTLGCNATQSSKERERWSQKPANALWAAIGGRRGGS